MANDNQNGRTLLGTSTSRSRTIVLARACLLLKAQQLVLSIHSKYVQVDVDRLLQGQLVLATDGGFCVCACIFYDGVTVCVVVKIKYDNKPDDCTLSFYLLVKVVKKAVITQHCHQQVPKGCVDVW